MATDTLGVLGAQAALVSDRDYEKIVKSMIGRARRRVWASLFMIDLATPDPKLRVLGAMHELAAAQWRGVDVRLLIGGSRDNLQMAESSAASLAVARQLNLASRWVTARFKAALTSCATSIQVRASPISASFKTTLFILSDMAIDAEPGPKGECLPANKPIGG